MNKEQEWERKNKVYERRLAGQSYRAIAAAEGIAVGTAHRWVQEVLDDTVLPNVESIRKQEVDRLMKMLDRLEVEVESDPAKYVPIQLKVSERLTRMLGVDMPTQIQVEKTETTQLDLAVMDLLNRQKAQNQLRLESASHLRTDPPADEESD